SRPCGARLPVPAHRRAEAQGVPGQRQGAVRAAVTRQVVAKASEVAPGAAKVVTVKGREIGLFNLEGEYFALANRCPHAGGPLCRGRIVALVQSEGPGHYRLARQHGFLPCPWHRCEVRIRPGQSWCDPNSARARAVKVSVEPGRRW